MSSTGAEGQRPHSRLRHIARSRGLFLAGGAVSLIALAPTSLHIYGQLGVVLTRHGSSLAIAAGFEAVGFASIWQLQRLIMRARWSDVAVPQLVGNAVSNIVPAGSAMGAVVQLRLLGLRGVDLPTAVSSLAMASLLSGSAGVGVWLLLVALPFGGAGVSVGTAQIAALAAAPVVVGCVALASMSDMLPRALELVVHRIAGGRAARRVDAVRDQLARQRRWTRTLLRERRSLIGVTLLGHALGDYLALYVAVLAVSPAPAPSMVLLAFLTANAAGAIPFTPGGLGFVEAGLTGALAVAGLRPEQAIVAVAIYRVASCWLPVAAGAVAFATAVRRPGGGRVVSPRAAGELPRRGVLESLGRAGDP